MDLCQLAQAARPGSSLHPSAVGLALIAFNEEDSPQPKLWPSRIQLFFSQLARVRDGFTVRCKLHV